MNMRQRLLKDTVPVVAIGVEKSSVDALLKLSGDIPADSGLAYVIVSGADQDGDIAGKLSTEARVTVGVLDEDRKIEPDVLYVLPSTRVAKIEDDMISVAAAPVEEDASRRPHPIDRFLCHLAQVRGREAVGVLLDDTNADGAIGLRQIKLNGGVAIVADCASHTDATSIFTVAPDRIVNTVVALKKHQSQMEQDIGSDRLFRQVVARLDDILTLVADEQNVDLNTYKTGILVRRVARRMSINGLTDVSEYAAFLRESRDERRALTSDFLIGTTQFFRDPDGLAALKDKVLRPMLDSDRDTFRIWVPGCSTGEDVYSIAMLAREIADEARDRRPWRIFGTDIDVGVLRRARCGVFDVAASRDLTRERLDRFFERDGDHLTAVQSLRNMCVFAPHVLLQDPPFSKLDAISCRNVLRYLNKPAQKKLMRQFHYALNGGGSLWLGPAEGACIDTALFDPIDAEACLFRRNPRPSDLDIGAFTLPDRRDWRPSLRARTVTDPAPVARDVRIESAVQRTLARDLAPPYLAVRHDGTIVYLSEAMTKLTDPAPGRTGTTIDTLLPAELRGPVRLLLSRAIGQTGPVSLPAIAVGEAVHDLSAVRADGTPDIVVVTFQPAAQPALGMPLDDDSRALIQSRQRLTSLELEYETIERELRDANEDLSEANADLQNSNEALETSREELQSLNEELETVNAELSENNRRIVEAHEDLANLFDATNIATLFLDDQQRIRRFTPALKRLFRIRNSDTGRTIGELANVLAYPELTDDATAVHAGGKPVSREVSTRDGDATFAVELRPYRTQNSGSSGVVVSFFDISDQKYAANRLAETADQMARQIGELEALYDAIPLGLSLIDRNHQWIKVNATLAEINGLGAEESIGEDARKRLEDVAAQIEPIIDRVFQTEEPVTGVRISGETPAKPGEIRDWIVDYIPVRANEGVFAVGTVVRDITTELTLERRIASSEARLHSIFNRVPASVSMHRGPDHDCIYLNSRYTATLRALDPPGTRFLDAWGAAEETIAAVMDEVFASGESESLVGVRTRGPRGAEHVSTISVLPWHDDDGQITGVLTFALDTSEEEAARRAAEEERKRLQRLRDSLGVFIGLLDLDGRLIEVNETVIDRSFIGKDDVLGRPFWECYWWSFDADVAARVRAEFERAKRGELVRYDTDVRLHEDEVVRIDFQMVPVFDADGTVIEVVPSGIDVSARVAAEKRKDVLLAELEHRVKNTLATVQAITRFTARSTDSKEAFEGALIDRIGAISRTHDTLTGNEWEGESLRALIEAEVAPYTGDDGTRLSVEGDDVVLMPSDAMAMGLALHELSTNAAKYGAFAAETGHLSIRITASDDRLSALEWRETGVRLATTERKSGFGTYLLENVLKQDLDMDITLEFKPSGLVCKIRDASWMR